MQYFLSTHWKTANPELPTQWSKMLQDPSSAKAGVVKVACRAWYLAHVHQRKGGVWWEWSGQQQPQVHWLYSWVPTASCHLPGGRIPSPPVSLLWNILTDMPRYSSSVSWNLFKLTAKHWRKVVLLKTFSLFLKLSPMYIAEYDRIYSPISSSRFPYKLPSFMPFNFFSFR